MTTEIEILDPKEVKEGIEKKKKGYKKYIDAVDRINLIGWAKEEIGRKSDRTIVVKINDVVEEMGPEFEKIGHSMLYQALKVIFFDKGIFLSIGTHRDGDKVFVLREIRKGDRLPQSYSYTKQRVKEKIKDGKVKDNKEKIENIVDMEAYYNILLEKERKKVNALNWQVRKLKQMLKKDESGKDKSGQIEEEIRDKIKIIEETDVECPWCGSKNISKWPIIQVIRTRSGERKLKFRCKDCNETFGDEDIKISSR